MTIDLRTIRAVLLLGAAAVFFTAAGMNVHHPRKTVILLGVGLALIALDRFVALLIEGFWRDR